MDTAGFKSLFLPLSKKLYRVAFRLMGNEQDAEDMVQEAYLRLWKRKDELSGLQNAEAYCVTLIKNVCYDALNARHTEEVDIPPDMLSIPDSTREEEQIEQRDEANQVKQLISHLPEPQQTIIRMKDVNGLSYEEIQQLTGYTPVNIRVILSRARHKIREQFMQIRNYGNK